MEIVNGFINAIYDKNIHEGNLIKENYPNITVRKYIFNNTNCLDKKMLDSLKLVQIAEDVLEKKINVLSTSEKLKIELAIILINNEEVIILNDFTNYFMEKDLLFFKKLFKKLVSKYHKTIVLVNCNLSFLFDITKRIIIKKGKEDIVIDDPNFYEEELKCLDNYPPILDFVVFLEERGRKIKNYTDLKELLKAIFREV